MKSDDETLNFKIIGERNSIKHELDQKIVDDQKILVINEQAKELINQYIKLFNQTPSIKLTTTNNYLVFYLRDDQ